MNKIITLTSKWPRWRLKSPASRLFTQPFIQTQIKENIKALHHWPLCGEFTGTGEFPAQRASYADNVSIWWRHHVFPPYGVTRPQSVHPFSSTPVQQTGCHWCKGRVEGANFLKLSKLDLMELMCQLIIFGCSCGDGYHGIANWFPYVPWRMITSLGRLHMRKHV